MFKINNLNTKINNNMEKSFYKRLLLLTISMITCSMATFAQDFSAVNEDGMTLCYNILYDEDDQPTTTVELADGGKDVTYSGYMTIPETVVNPNDDQTYTVVGIFTIVITWRTWN